MKIARMNKVNMGKLRAFFDLELDMGITIKGFKIMEGINGFFVSMPSQKKDNEYYDTIFCSKEVREQINQIALDYYNQETKSDEPILNKQTDNEELPF